MKHSSFTFRLVKMFGQWLVILGCVFTFASVIQCGVNDLMLSYERSKIDDDCNVRFYKQRHGINVAPSKAERAYLREFAHIAAIGWTNEDQSVRWLCGGSLIWENFILTAAHCTTDQNNVPPDVARMGDINIYSDEDDEFAQQLRIVDIIRHPMHRFSSTYYDIALMKLEQNVTVHDTVAPTCLWLDDEIRFPALLAAGWGKTGIAEDLSQILLKVQLAPIINEKCSSYYGTGDRMLLKGLKDHQLCAGDEKMDTCPGDSGGPLHVKLLKEWKLIPFLVGVTSFGKACGVSAPGVYVKVSKFGDWIIETLQRHGEMATRFKFEPLVCAERYYKLREYKEDVVNVWNGKESFNWNIYFSHYVSDNIVGFAQSFSHEPVKSNCSGTLIEPNVVLTLAECVANEGSRPTQVVLPDNNILDVAEIIIHPLYNSSISPYYNNIAVVKLKSFARILPYCALYGNSNPGQKMLLTGQQLIPEEHSSEPRYMKLMTRVWEQSFDQCRLASKYSNLLPMGLLDEHLCFENQPFLVPGYCDTIMGSPIENNNGDIHGINLFGRDNGFGEPAVGVRLSAHKAWLESVLLSHIKSDVFVYIDPDLKLGDKCQYANRTKGTCVIEQNCPAIHLRLQSKLSISFCSNRNVVCCPNKATDSRMIAIENEFNQCEERYRHLRTDRQNGNTHAVEIGWQNHHNTTYGCYGYLISTRGVVSSASCLLEKDDLPNIARVGGIDSLDHATIIQIEKVVIHPQYNRIQQQHNIALVRLKLPVNPMENVFPACLWQNITHSPVKQIVLDFASKRNDPIHPMYKSDCEVLLNRSFDDPDAICLNPGICFYTIIMHINSLRTRYESEEGINICYAAGSPIIWRKDMNDSVYVDYLVHMYSYGSCDCNTPRVVIRIAAYIDWFKAVLQ